jgi:hypothetical protein
VLELHLATSRTQGLSNYRAHIDAHPILRPCFSFRIATARAAPTATVVGTGRGEDWPAEAELNPPSLDKLSSPHLGGQAMASFQYRLGSHISVLSFYTESRDCLFSSTWFTKGGKVMNISL